MPIDPQDPHPRWTDTELRQVDVGPVRYFKVYSPLGALIGALWLGQRRPYMGFEGPDEQARDLWLQRCNAVSMASRDDCRAAFDYWYNVAAGTYMWEAGPIEEAPSVDALRGRLGL